MFTFTVFSQLKMSLDGEEKEVLVRRNSIVNDVLTLYEDHECCTKRLKVTFEGEEGEDMGGLTKEMMTIFWKEVTKEYFQGEHVTVPSLPLYRCRKESAKFVAIGRALTHSAALTETLPCRIARCVIISMVFEDVNTEYLLEDFLLYVSTSEKHILAKALSDFHSLSPSELKQLGTFFSVNGLTELPKGAEITDQIKAIAEEKMLKAPSRFYQLMKQGLPSHHMETFWSQLTLDHLTHIYQVQRPTVPGVLSALKTQQEDLRPEEETVFYYLQDYVRSLDTDELLNFLLFVTASIHMPDEISVSFVGTFGLSRRPVAHTCANLLEISTNYFSLQEFKREMKTVLNDPESYRYSSA